MTFAAMTPAALIASLLAAALAVVALYLLRRTPRAQTVSNVDFWRRAAERSRPRSLFATRVPWLALLLSLSIATLLVVEMGDPRPSSGFSGTTVIVLDADRTMAARDDRGHRRMDDALAIVRQTVQADTVSGQIAIVRAGVQPEVIVPLTHRARDADRALTRTGTDDGTADLAAAIELARAIIRTAHTAGRVLVVADRGDFARATVASIPVVLAAVGSTGESLAITALDARRDPTALGEYRVRCEVRSYAARTAQTHLVIRDRDVVVSDEHLTLRPGEVRTHQSRGFSSNQGELTARLEDIAIDGGRDVLASDDVAYAVVPPVVATHVLLVTRGNRYLENALAANPTVDLERVDANGLAARRIAPGGLGRYNVIILDRFAPQPPLDHPALFLVGAADHSPMRFGAERSQPRVTAFAADHRVLAGLRFDQIQIARARPLVTEGDDRVLVRSGRDALVVARDRAGSRVIALGFDTDDTDLVQRIAFPLFVHNALVWLDRRERDYHSWQSPGEPVRAAGSQGLVLLPGGEGREVRGALFDTARAGIYHSSDRAVAVSAADEAGSLATNPEENTVHPTQPRARPSLAMLVAAAMLVLLTVEWLLTQRGRLQ